MRTAIAAAALLLCAFELHSVARKLHGILYQMTLTNCMAQADRGIRCKAAGPETPERKR